MHKGRHVKKEIIEETVKVKGQQEGDKGNNPSDQNNNGKQNYSFLGTCSNCGRFGHKYLQCGKYGYGCNTLPSGQKMIYPNFKKPHHNTYNFSKYSQAYRMFPFHQTFRSNQMGQHCLYNS